MAVDLGQVEARDMTINFSASGVLHLDLSPYTLVARKYRENLDSDTSWMQSHSTFGSLFRGLGLWYPPLVGLPFAAAADLFRLAGGFSTNTQTAARTASNK